MSQELPASKNEQQHAYERDEVVKIINSVISKIEGQHGKTDRSVHSELKDLLRIINEARAEIGASRASDISEKHIPTAADELDAIVAATAEATGTIMDCAERIQDQAAIIGGDAADILEDEVTKIYEACSFQDITGQRITKVITTLQLIEERVNKLVNIIGHVDTSALGVSEKVKEEEKTGDEALLNGPQLPDNAISQEEIDRLLDSFDD